MTNTVTFPVSIGGDGSTVTDDASTTTGLANGGHRTRFLPALSNIVAIAATLTARILNNSANSTTSVLIGAGTKTFTTDKAYNWSIGQWCIAANPTAANNFMTGQVTAYSSTTGIVTLNVTIVGGSGTYATWTLSTSPAPVSPNPAGTINSITVTADRVLVDTYQYETGGGSVINNAVTLTVPQNCLVIFDNYTQSGQL